ncbi:cell surface protein [Moraxella catarrhalis]|uniref:YadA C-terminal domain-containing protein n=1 Tax=Moraxella catarrhalis TaxID=480 RepID=UPI00128E920B|nr:YadA C-terminal domain-containing protein [Moraxella catarrhalis]MPW51471.1 cell surface protein [Moraxella catarrhalis]
MKTMKLLPLKIAVTSALIVGLGAASTANAQLVERFFPNIFLDKPLAKQHYHNVVVGDTSIVSDLQSNSDQLKFYSDDEGLVPDSLLFNKMLHEQLLNGFKEGDTIIPLDENGKPVYKVDYKLDGKEPRKVYSVTTKIATAEDVATSSYANGIQKDIDDLYDFDHQVTERLTQHGKTIYRNGERILANEESVQYLNKEVQNNIEHIYELAQQQDQHSSDIKTLKKNVEEGLLELSGHLIDQKADIDNNINHIYELAQQQDQHSSDIKTLKKNVEEGLLELSGHLIDQKSDIAQNQTDIQDLAAYNELQDQYAQKQTEAIDALNKASSENTQNIAKNQADIANNINNIYELAQQQDQHSSDIKTLAKASAANTDRIAKNKADADASFETLTKNQNTLIEKDKEHDKLITANKTAIDANKASADTKFAATADAITKNGNAITKNAKSITDLGTKVDGFDGRVTALDTKVNAFDGRITALDSKVENGMAAQAALSGLFQPYSVGKFNATAALGGYGSKSAVAIGAGYRVNPNLAFKAGAAINTSGNKKGSYNIGVNYEF